jgi:hypothetical protein
MAKRFTDTDKWKKPFIKTLKAPYKLLWLYILDDCDHSGMWQVDIEVAQIRIGETIDLREAANVFGDKITVLENGEKWFIQDFIDFQYGQLNPENRAHKSVLNLLDKYKNKGLTSSLQGAKDKEQDKDMVKVMDKEKEQDIEERRKNFYESIGSTYSDKYPKEMLLAFCNYWTEYNEGGKRMKFEMQKVFNTAMRLVTWNNNNKQFKNGKAANGITKDGLIEAYRKRTQSANVDNSAGG